MIEARVEESSIQETRRQILPSFIGLSSVLLASLLLPLPAANGQIARIPSLCPFYRLTGLPCPACGLTRAFVCIGHGQWVQSLHWHPAGWLVYLGFVFFWIRAGVILKSGRKWLPVAPAQGRQFALAALLGLVFVGGLRIAWLTIHHLKF